jgi:hypothetical protein
MNRTMATPQAVEIPMRAVVVHGLEQAKAALALGQPVALLSAPGAALAGGCGWWRAMIVLARAAFPQTTMIDILDCADAPGFAMAALRAGQCHMVLNPACPGFAAVAAAAQAHNAVLLAQRPPALDLDQRGAVRRLETYLR